MKTVTSKKTVQSETSNLRETLINANVDGFTIEFINSLSLQELNTIIDNLQIVNKTDGKKAKRNISVDVLNYFLKKDKGNISINVYTYDEVTLKIAQLNLGNYFELPTDYNLNNTIQVFNAEILCNRIVTSKKTVTNLERKKEWLKRKTDYLNSHLLGTTDKASLFNNENSNHYFKKFEDGLIIVEKSKQLKKIQQN